MSQVLQNIISVINRLCNFDLCKCYILTGLDMRFHNSKIADTETKAWSIMIITVIVILLISMKQMAILTIILIFLSHFSWLRIWHDWTVCFIVWISRKQIFVPVLFMMCCWMTPMSQGHIHPNIQSSRSTSVEHGLKYHKTELSGVIRIGAKRKTAKISGVHSWAV